jgi:D-3-phosphoglycerate dehydrogenase / 2-oxoglutarate reductase
MRVLIVDEMHPSIVQMPKELGLEVDYFPNITKTEVLAKVSEYQGLIIRSKFQIDQNFLSYATQLRFIGRAGAGLDLIDIDACQKRNISIFAANEGNRVAVAEHLIGLILCLFNKIHLAHEQVKTYVWKREENRGEELYGKTVGIIGYGNNGEATAKRLLAFGCNILAYDKYKYGFGDPFIKEASMEEIYKNADILSLHIPLTDLTHGMVNDHFIEKFDKAFYFCNISRGEIVDTASILKAINSGKIKGAVLDVLENEKFNTLSADLKASYDALFSKPQVLLSPHIAGWTYESYKRINEVLKDKIKRYLDSTNA